MAKFITGQALEKAVYDIIWEAEAKLLIVSPFIKLDRFFKMLFEKHLNNPNIQITIVFGKNEQDVSKSLNESDLEFFKQFPNISIVYVPNLHAKYYGNESNGVVTSINLYDYSFINNIEFGVFYENKFLNKITKNTDEEVWETCRKIAEENQAFFIKRPVIERKLFSSIRGNKYIKSEVLYDITLGNNDYSIKTIKDFPVEVDLDSEEVISSTRDLYKKAPFSQSVRKTIKEIEPTGYCIRTGVPIPFDIDNALSEYSFRTWSQYGNSDYPERYCHFSGEPSYGETSVNRPVLYKNWKLAMEMHKSKMEAAGF